jgi:hypothetical protein
MSCSPFSDLTFTVKATSWVRERDSTEEFPVTTAEYGRKIMHLLRTNQLLTTGINSNEHVTDWYLGLLVGVRKCDGRRLLGRYCQ